MNKRCIVNVATGDFYCKMQSRLLDSFMPLVDIVTVIEPYQKPVRINFQLTDDRGIDLMLWKDALPTGSRSHEESPYGFKVYAIKAAYEMGYTSILWLDSPAYAVKEDISPIFNRIESAGYYAMSHIDPLDRFIGDSILKYCRIEREDLVDEYCNKLNLPSGSCYGFDFRCDSVGGSVFMEMEEYESEGRFANEVKGDIVHRHDEAVLALSLFKRKLPVFTFDPLFQSDSNECVIKSGG